MGQPNLTASASASDVLESISTVSLAELHTSLNKNTFLQVVDNDLMKVNIESQHEVLHQVMCQRAAGAHPFQCHGNGLGFKSTDHNREPADFVDLTQNNRIGMRLGDAKAIMRRFPVLSFHARRRYVDEFLQI